MSEYAKQSDLDRLVLTVENLVIESKESRQDIVKLSIDAATERSKFTVEVTQLTEVLKEIKIQIGELTKVNTRHGIIKEMICKAPRFVTSLFFIFCTFVVVVSTDVHKDLLKYGVAMAKVRYGI